jgi:regulator of PEP synthase PpsR (kinase-PPPase family)
VTTIARACLVQYENVEVKEHFWGLVRTSRQMKRVIEGIKRSPGLVVFTLLNHEIRGQLERPCRQLHIPCVAALDSAMQAFSNFFDQTARSEIGKQHTLDDGYFRRIDAMHFAVQHDDSQSMRTMTDADIILVGVSRTSKTPTCLYLANRGLWAGNIAVVRGVSVSDDIASAQKPLFVGLTREPKSLSDIRQSRLRIMNDDQSQGYADLDKVREEVVASRRLFAKYGWSVIDVTRKSIEETAAIIIQLYNQRNTPTS